MILKTDENVLPVLIIGAGPAGLTAGNELSKFGIKFSVLESDSQVGGLSRTVDYKGYRFDIGGHRFFSKAPYIRELWKEILDKDMILRPRLSRIYYNNTFFDYPLKPLNALKGLGLVEALIIIASYLKVKLTPVNIEDNFEQWVINRFGTRLYKIFFKTYTEKVWGVPCHEISADWAEQRIKSLSLRKAVYNALINKNRNGELITTLIEQFHYPKLGPGQMWERCRELSENNGNSVLTNHRVTAINHRNGTIKSVVAQNKGKVTKEFKAQHFISSMPLNELLFSLEPAPPENILNIASNLRYRDYLTVVLIVDRGEVFPDNWIYIHSPEVKMGRIQNYKNWSSLMVPDSCKTSLGLEYFLWKTDEKWNWSDKKLIDLGIKECSQLGLIAPSEVEDGTVIRMPKAYPLYDHEYYENLKTIRNYLQHFKNLQTIGRNGLHRYNNQDHSMLTGVYAARNIVGESYDVWSVNTERLYHEEDAISDKATGTVKELSLISKNAKAAKSSRERDPIDAIFSKIDPMAMGIAVAIVSGMCLFSITIILLLKGGETVGPTLSLLGNYLYGFQVTWLGSLIGFIEAGIAGFFIGFILAFLRNFCNYKYTTLLYNRATLKENSKLLDKV